MVQSCACILLISVRSFGTEDRPTERPVPPRDEVFEYIIFRGTDIKDLHVCEPPQATTLHQDPAIVKVCSNLTSQLLISALSMLSVTCFSYSDIASLF